MVQRQTVRTSESRKNRTHLLYLEPETPTQVRHHTIHARQVKTIHSRQRRVQRYRRVRDTRGRHRQERHLPDQVIAHVASHSRGEGDLGLVDRDGDRPRLPSRRAAAGLRRGPPPGRTAAVGRRLPAVQRVHLRPGKVRQVVRAGVRVSRAGHLELGVCVPEGADVPHRVARVEAAVLVVERLQRGVCAHRPGGGAVESALQVRDIEDARVGIYCLPYCYETIEVGVMEHEDRVKSGPVQVIHGPVGTTNAIVDVVVRALEARRLIVSRLHVLEDPNRCEHVVHLTLERRRLQTRIHRSHIVNPSSIRAPRRVVRRGKDSSIHVLYSEREVLEVVLLERIFDGDGPRGAVDGESVKSDDVRKRRIRCPVPIRDTQGLCCIPVCKLILARISRRDAQSVRDECLLVQCDEWPVPCTEEQLLLLINIQNLTIKVTQPAPRIQSHIMRTHSRLVSTTRDLTNTVPSLERETMYTYLSSQQSL